MELIDSKHIYSGRIIVLREDILKRDDGSLTKWSVVEHPGAVAMLPIDGDKIILVKQFRYATNEILLEIPAGTREKNESAIETARRELQEEIGKDSTNIVPFGGFYTAPGFTNEYIDLFIARDLVPVYGVEPDEDEDIQIEIVTLNDAVDMIGTGLIKDAKTIAALMRFINIKGA